MKWIVVSLLLSAFAVQAELKIEEKTKYYVVSPKSLETLPKDIDEVTPIREGGSVFHGYTYSHIKWRFWWKKRRHFCRINKVKTSLKIEYTMPKLDSNDKEVKRVWDAWYPNLQLHEKLHGDLAKKYAKKIDEEISNLKPNRDCEELGKEANRIGNSYLKKLDAESKQYDKETNHGLTQNAWLDRHVWPKRYKTFNKSGE